MAGIFYGVGVGPGDPGLLTLKAKQILEEAEVIAVPVKKPGEKSTAFEIIRQVVETEGKEILETVFYMTADPSVWRSCAKEAAALVEARLKKEKKVVLITLGDVTVYSTCMYVQQYVAAKGYRTELIPGISSYSAGAACAGIALAEGKETLAVVPALKNPEQLGTVLELFDNVILMKASKSIRWLGEYMRQEKIPRTNAVVLCCVGLPGEYIGPLDESREYGYFTTVIVKKGTGGLKEEQE